ncbi:MAG: exo-alpha-sialidase [Clostridiales bacterium]|nr:exo-alpha-sialidase [Clostridiales bacterium]
MERVLLRTKSGAIILAFTNEKEIANWNWQEDIHDSPGAMAPTYVVRSLDGGKTWIDLKKLHDDWTGANRDIIETRNGNIVLSSMMLRHNPGHHTVVTYTSKTDGFNWIRSNVIDLGGIGHHSGAIEATIEQLRDGRMDVNAHKLGCFPGSFLG